MINIYYLKCNTNGMVICIDNSQNIDQEVIKINLENECKYNYIINVYFVPN